MPTKAQLDAEIESQLPTNGIGLITAAILRPVLHDMVGFTAQQAAITRAQIPLTLIGTPNTFTVTGYSTAGDLGAGAIYTSTGAGPGSPGAIQDVTGNWFQLLPNSNSEFSVGWFGATGNGHTNDTAAFQACYAACGNPVSGNWTMTIPIGSFLVDGLVWDGDINVRGAGSRKTTFIASTDNIAVIQLVGAHGIWRDDVLEVGHFGVDGTGGPLSTFNGTGIHIKYINFGHLRDLSARNCYAGMHIEGGQFCHYDKLTSTFNTVGVRHTDDLTGTGGGGNSNQFSELDSSNNVVGYMGGRTGMPFPMGSNIFINPIIQSNTMTAVFLLAQGDNMFTNFAPEGNANGDNGPSGVFFGETITLSTLQFTQGSNALFTGFAPDDAAPFLVQDGSNVNIVNGSIPNFAADANSTVRFQGWNGNGAELTNIILDLNDSLDTNVTQLGANEPAHTFIDQSFPNDWPVPNDAPTPNADNTAGTGFNTDPNLGLVSTVTFNAVAGSASTNRVGYQSSDTAYPIGAHLYISFLVKTNITGQFTFQCMQSLITYGPVTITAGEWKRVLAKNYNYVGLTRTNQLLIWPEDNHGATLQLCRFVSIANARPHDVVLLSRDHRWNPRTKEGYQIRLSSIPTVGTWVAGDKVYNSAPAPSGFIGWVCTTGGTPGTWKTWGAISA